MRHALEIYRDHKVGAHMYERKGDDELWAVHVDGNLCGSMLGNADIAMKIGRDHVDRMPRGVQP